MDPFPRYVTDENASLARYSTASLIDVYGMKYYHGGCRYVPNGENASYGRGSEVLVQITNG